MRSVMELLGSQRKEVVFVKKDFWKRGEGIRSIPYARQKPQQYIEMSRRYSCHSASALTFVSIYEH